MSLAKRLRYYRRIFAAYLGSGRSQLTFWHDDPAPNPNFVPGKLGEYYQDFPQKADYASCMDEHGIPMLDYRGALGPQYNPIAIAQYGLGNYNLWRQTGDPKRRAACLHVADWMVEQLEPNPSGYRVWMHKFDWDYRDTLRAPWYSGLAQGQGISLLLRAHAETGQSRYLDAAAAAFECFHHDIMQGGVTCVDERGHTWIEEYIVHPPTHILNGFMWASWGIYDFALVTGDATAQKLFGLSVETLAAELPLFDTGYWSLYELGGTRLPMVTSTFYHRLHIAQLRVLFRLTGNPTFADFAERWEGFRRASWNRRRAVAQKIVFKLCYY